jgi:hypothetical protein
LKKCRANAIIWELSIDNSFLDKEKRRRKDEGFFHRSANRPGTAFSAFGSNVGFYPALTSGLLDLSLWAQKGLSALFPLCPGPSALDF